MASAAVQSYVANPMGSSNTFMSKNKTSITLDMEPVIDDVYQPVQRKSSIRRKHSNKGFVLGHGIQAVQLDAGAEFAINSIHGVFIGTVSNQTPVVYYLERLQNSNESVVRTVEGRQNGRIVFSGIASLSKINKQAPETVDPLSRRKMSSIPSPDSLPKLQAAYEQNQSTNQTIHMPKEFEKAMERLTTVWDKNNVEFRAIDQKCWLSPCEQNKESARFWVRCKSTNDSNPKQAVLGFLSGLCAEAMPGQRNALSSQQTMWFNQVDFEPNQWIYCELSALQQIRQHGNFLMCKFWNQNGDILASAVQEGDLAVRAKF